MTDGMDTRIRRATADDAETLLDLINALGADLGDPPVTLTADELRRDGFGEDPWFVTFLAEQAGAAVGYAMTCTGFSTDLGGRGVHLADLYVRRDVRRLGIGRGLMAAVAAHAVARGGKWVTWDVWTENARAQRFYESLGATHRDDVRTMVMRGGALASLAGDAANGGHRA